MVMHLKIMVVAQVLSVQAQTTNVVYLLNDGTARYEARVWVPNNEEDASRPEIRLVAIPELHGLPDALPTLFKSYQLIN